MLLLSMSLLAQPVAAKSSDPRGIRNNNPGNIVKTGITWKGEIECSDTRFECFESPEMGLRAMIKNIDTYSTKYGLNTVEGIVGRWSPKHENDTQSITREIKRVLRDAGISSFDIRSSYHYSILLREIIKSENGNSPFTDREVLEIVSDTSRVIDDGGKYIARWSDETLVSVYRSQEATLPHAATIISSETVGYSGCSEGRQTTVCSKSDSYLISDGDSSPTKISRTMGHSSNVWMDRVPEWILVLYGGERRSSMALSKWRGNPPDSPRHSPRKCYYRPLFWWLPCW